MKKTFIAASLALAVFASCSAPIPPSSADSTGAVQRAVADVSPAEMVKRLSKGINLGNTLDAPTEGAWAPAAQEYYFDDYVAAGFNSVRIPVTWDKHLSTVAPYTVDPAFMARVGQIVDWALARNLAVVLNCHHEDWIRLNYPSNQIPRLESLWRQISQTFAQKSENLVFEIMNEPHDAITQAQVSDMNSRILAIIRQTNPNRNVILGGRNWNNLTSLITEVDFTIDAHLIGNYHSYDPWTFAGQSQGTWGSAQDIATMAADFKRAKDWSSASGVPVYIGEYGVNRNGETNSRIAWYRNFAQMARANGFAYVAWDDSGDFGLYNRGARTWDAAVLAAIAGPSPSPTPPVQSPYGGTRIAIPGTIEAEHFDNGGEGLAYHDTDAANSGGAFRSTGVDVEASSEGGYNVGWTAAGEFLNYMVSASASQPVQIQVRVASQPGNKAFHVEIDNAVVATFTAPATGGWQTYQTLTSPIVNLAAGNHTVKLAFDADSINVNWIKVVAVVPPSPSPSPSPSPTPPAQSPYAGTRIAIPGTIEAEHFDNGGEGLAYHDTDAANSGGAFRSTGVDVEASSEGGYNVGWTAAGEFLNYMVSASASQPVQIQVRVASQPGNKAFHVEIDNAVVATFTAPATGGWQTFQTLTSPIVNLAAGNHTVKLAFDADSINVNWIKVVAVVPPLPSVSLKSWLASSNSGGLTIWIGGVGDWNPGEWIRFAQVNLSSGYRTMSWNVASAVAATFEARLDSPTGPVLGTLNSASTGGWGTYAVRTIAIDATKTATHDVYVRCVSGALNLGEMTLVP